MKNQLVLVVICSTLTATVSGCGRSTASPPPAVEQTRRIDSAVTSLPAFKLTVQGFEQSLGRLGYRFTEREIAGGQGRTEHDGKVGTCDVAIGSHPNGVDRVFLLCTMKTEEEGQHIQSVYQEIVASISQTVREAAQAKNWFTIALAAKAESMTSAKDMPSDDVPMTTVSTDLTTFKIKFGSSEPIGIFWIEFEAKR